MKIKDYLKPLPVALLAAACGGQDEAQERPNIIVFLVDDMGVMDTQVPFLIDSAGRPVRHPLNRWYRTPNMERLAERGVRFPTFYAQSVSSPTRACLMTGQNAARHRTTNWINSESNNRTDYGPPEWNWQGIRRDSVTLPKLLSAAGYKTIHVGKAHFGPIGSEGEFPQNIGFDVNIAGSSIGQPGSYYGENGYGALGGNRSRAVPGLEKYHSTPTFLTDALTQEANAEITKAAAERRPFFLYMAHYAVHSPFEADPRFLGNYPESEKSAAASAFATLIEGMDKSLGDIMDHLEELNIAQNTLIIFLGDNGSDAPLGDENGHYSSAPLRGKKGTAYEGGMRVPFIAAWSHPDSTSALQQRIAPIRPNTIQPQMATVLDIFPTLLAIAGAANPEDHVIDGFDLRTQLSGRHDTVRHESFLMHFPHAHRGSYFTTYRNGDHKLIYHYNPETPTRPHLELYNLADDPHETTDLALADPTRARVLVLQMASALEDQHALYPQDSLGNSLKPLAP
ncbi:MAG: sulfatase [Tannerella sp.]|jgi:arylsulfatase A-like enzyme|nr:sulfatase [Tannerella sp.]